MKYMLMMNTAGGPYQIMEWPPEALQAHIDYMRALNADLEAAGEMVGAEGLAAPTEAKLVRAGGDGRPVTDGAFAETKEFLAGFWIVDVDGPERAYEIAARVSQAPGRDGEPLHMEVEVRQVMCAPKVEC
jgi:hypothetical protein